MYNFEVREETTKIKCKFNGKQDFFIGHDTSFRQKEKRRDKLRNLIKLSAKSLDRRLFRNSEALSTPRVVAK